VAAIYIQYYGDIMKIDKETKEYLVEDCLKKGLPSRKRAKLINDYMREEGVSEKDFAQRFGLTISGLRYKLSLLKVDEELYEEMKDAGMKDSEIRQVANNKVIKTIDYEQIFLDFLEDIAEIRNPPQYLLLLINKVSIRLDEIKHLIDVRMVNKE